MSMTVISLSDCPPRLRGDLSKWLFELNTGVYVGKLTARVREELWERICDNLAHGKATMVYTANNEQGMEFRVHQTTWQSVDYDGLTLMRRPLPAGAVHSEGQSSKAARMLQARNMQKARQRSQAARGYVVTDLETTGVHPQSDQILEIGAVRVVNHQIAEEFSVLIRQEQPIPAGITQLTGITGEEVSRRGCPLPEAMEAFLAFAGDSRLVFHNAGFDRAFLHRATESCGLPPMENRYEDTMVLAKKLVDDAENYKLETLAHYFGGEEHQQHRALADCRMTWFLYEKLKEIELS